MLFLNKMPKRPPSYISVYSTDIRRERDECSKLLILWRSLGELNPCFSLERANHASSGCPPASTYIHLYPFKPMICFDNWTPAVRVRPPTSRGIFVRRLDTGWTLVILLVSQ